MVFALVFIIIGWLMILLPKTPPPSSAPTVLYVPLPPPEKKKRTPRRPRWIAEIKVGRNKPRKTIKVTADNEGEALMALMAEPHNLAPRDILDLREG